METTALKPLLPFTVRVTDVRVGDLLSLEDDLRRVTETQDLETSTRFLFGGGFEDDLTLDDDAEVTVYRVPSDDEWWGYLLEAYDISRWPNG